MSNSSASAITYRQVKDGDAPGYWVAVKDGKIIARSMSEQGVRSIVMTIGNKTNKPFKAPEKPSNG